MSLWLQQQLPVEMSYKVFSYDYYRYTIQQCGPHFSVLFLILIFLKTKKLFIFHVESLTYLVQEGFTKKILNSVDYKKDARGIKYTFIRKDSKSWVKEAF